VQAIVEEIKSIALERHGKNKSGQPLEEQVGSAKKVTLVEIDYSWLNGEGTGINAVRDPTLRILLSLKPLLEAASAVVTAEAGTRGKSAVDDTESENEDDNDAKAQRGTSAVDKVGVLTEQTTPAKQPEHAAAFSAATIAGQSTPVAPEAAASDAASELYRHIGLVHKSHSTDRKNAEAIPLTPADEEGTLSEQTDGFEQGIPFSTEHLSQLLTASVSGTLKSMLSYVQRLKAINSEAFKELRQGENGARYKQENIAKIANSIAKCIPDEVTNAQGYLSWLVVSYVYVSKFDGVAVGYWSCFHLKHLHTRLTSVLWGNAGEDDTGKG